MRARARSLFLRTVFQILLRISQSNSKNENPKTDISALKSVFGFRVRLEIRNPDFENLNPDFPIERTPGKEVGNAILVVSDVTFPQVLGQALSGQVTSLPELEEKSIFLRDDHEKQHVLTCLCL